MDEQEVQRIPSGIAAGRYSDIQLSSFVTACSAKSANRDELVALSGQRTNSRHRLYFDNTDIGDLGRYEGHDIVLVASLIRTTIRRIHRHTP